MVAAEDGLELAADHGAQRRGAPPATCAMVTCASSASSSVSSSGTSGNASSGSPSLRFLQAQVVDLSNIQILHLFLDCMRARQRRTSWSTHVQSLQIYKSF